nr:hypothetical protein [Tanacetum cinerariifolium]
MPPKRNSMSVTAIEWLISQRIADVLLDYEANRNSGNENKNGNGIGNNNGNGSLDSGSGHRRKGNVTSSKPKRLQEAILIANNLTDQKVRVHATRQADNKRRIESNPYDDHVQRPPYKRYEHVAINLNTSTSSCCHHRENLQGFAAVLAVLITGASQSRQHNMSEQARRSLTD